MAVADQTILRRCSRGGAEVWEIPDGPAQPARRAWQRLSATNLAIVAFSEAEGPGTTRRRVSISKGSQEF